MTRRLIVYQMPSGEYAVAQEFNGDRAEMNRIHSMNHLVRANWPTIVALFNGVKTMDGFKKALTQAEDFYGYEHDPLTVVKEMPVAEEVWLLDKGKLNLVRRYSEEVKMSEDGQYYDLHNEIRKSLHKLSGGRVFQMLSASTYLPIPWDSGKHNYGPGDYKDMVPGQYQTFVPMFGNVNPVYTTMVRLV